jgi:3',5'-cyclic-AMP phosphodiesterase
MKILKLDEKPFHRLRFLNAAKGGGTESQTLPFLRGVVDRLPDDIDALILTSDLQGVVPFGNTTRLLGEEVASLYPDLAKQNGFPSPDRTGVLLAGDLYAAPQGDKRGASGDVRSVWLAFADLFQWVVGVEGNHDRFGTAMERSALMKHPNIHLLDYGTVQFDTLRIGGVSGIMGDPQKPGRRDESTFLSALQLVQARHPEILILHQGPRGRVDQRGDEQVTQHLTPASDLLTVCGHVHWTDPLAELNPTNQVINVDSRVVVLTR